MDQVVKPTSRSLLTVEFLGSTAGLDEMSITRDLIAAAHDRAKQSNSPTVIAALRGDGPLGLALESQ